MSENEDQQEFNLEGVKRHLRVRHDALIVSIDKIALQVDCEHAFVALASSQMMKMSGEGGYTECEHGMIPALIELAAFHLYPHFGQSDNRDHGLYQQLFDQLEKLNTLRGLNTAFGVDHSRSDLSSLQVKLLLNAESVRGSSYPHQTRHRIENIQGPHEKWFRVSVGIGPLRILEILDCFEQCVNEKLAQQHNRFEKLSDEMLSLVGEKSAKSSSEEIDERCLLGNKMKEFVDDAAAIFSVSYAQVASNLGDLTHEEWTALAKLVGTTTESRSEMSHPRDMRRRPVFFLEDTRFLIVDYSSALDAVFEAFDDLTRCHQKFRDRKYVPIMSDWMEAEAIRCFKRVFPATAVYSGLVYPDPDNEGGEAELDGAILWGPFLVLSEVKGKQFRSRSRLGDPARLRSDIKASISEAFDQASRAIRYIRSSDSVTLKEKSTGRELTICKDSLCRIYPVSVTLHHFGGLATQLAQLDKLGLFGGASYPWSLSLGDLDTITRFASTPDVFLHYVQRRIELQESQEEIMGDELDLFGEYLDSRLHPSLSWGSKPEENGNHRMFAFSGGSARFDAWFQAEQGQDIERPEIKLNLPAAFAKIIEELRNRDDDGARWIAFALLGLSNDGVRRVTEALQELRSLTVGSGRIGRVMFQEGDLVVSIIGGEGISTIELRKQITNRCAIEKYRLKAQYSLVIGLRVENEAKPFDCACWLEGPWVEDPDLEDFLESESPKLAPGCKLPGRNELCFCGSRKKFKKCCIGKIRK